MSIAVDPIQNTGRIDAIGGAFDTAATQVTEFLSVWPGMAQNYPDGQATLARQILAATSNAAAASFELSTRAGRLGGITNPVDILSTQHPDGYGASFLVPSHAYYWNWTLSAADCNIRDRSYSTSDKWFLTNVSIAHDNATATREVRATYQRDIDIDGFATPGQAIIYPPQNDTPISIPDIPPFPAFDTIPEVPDWFDPSIASIDDEIPVPNLVGGSTNPFTHPNPPRNGNTLLFGSATQAWVSQNLLIAKKPKYVEVTPTGITAIQMGLLDQRAGKTGAWLLDYDSGTDQSWVWYTANVYAARPEWSQGATLNAKYTVLRQTSTGIAVYSPAAPAPSTYTLAYQGDSGTTGLTVTSTGPNTWHVSAAYYNAALERYFIELYFLNGAARYCTVKWTITNMTGWSNANFSLTNNGSVDEDGICGTRHAAPDGLAPGNGWQQWYDSQGYSAGDIGMLDIRSRSAFEFDISVVIPAATAARVVYSADNGETYSANSSVGTSPGSVGGFDVVRSGGTAIAAADAQAYKATSIGGAYSSLGSDGATSGSQPILLIIPYYQWGSTTTKNYPSSTPDYLLGSAALVSSEALWKVTGAGGRTAITNTISGNKAIPVGPNAATMIYGTKLAYLGTAGGNRYLSVSTNSGTSWTSVAVGSSAVFCRVRRGSTSQLYVADDTAIKYSKSFNTTLVSITTPGSALTWLDILG